jgi:hypothetical protein
MLGLLAGRAGRVISKRQHWSMELKKKVAVENSFGELMTAQSAGRNGIHQKMVL